MQPLQLGPYAAFEYYLITPEQIAVRFIAFAHETRLIFISLSPANSPAQDEAMAAALRILETLTFEPS